MTVPRPLRLALLALAPMLAGAGAARAQGLKPGGTCTLEFYPRDPSTPPATTAIRPPGAENYNVYVSGGAQYKCQGQDVTLTADSTEYLESLGLLHLVGHVKYREPRVRVDAARMTYYQAEDRLLAEGGVEAVTPAGTTMRGPTVEYFRAVPNRPRARMIATGRPETKLVQRDSTGKAAEPVTIISDRIVSDADSLVYASGRVDIQRTDIAATADSAFFDSGKEYARLMRKPQIRSKPRRPNDRTFTLVGTTIDLFSRQRQLQRVIALGGGEATSADLTLTADTLDLRVSQGRMERAYAWGPTRAHAVSPERDIVADSLDVWMPAQRLREVRALRDALAQTEPDSTRIRSGERDWIRGDTVVARFDTTAVATASGDTTKQPPLREVVARGDARSYYQIASQEGGPTRPAVNYVRGGEIVLHFARRASPAPVVPATPSPSAVPLPAGGATAAAPRAEPSQQLETVTVIEQAAGIYLEPNRDSTARRSATDSTGRAAPRRTPTAGAPRTPARTPTRTPTGTPSRRPPVRRPDS